MNATRIRTLTTALQIPTGYGIWVRPDCNGTEFETGNRTWFYFSVAGGRLGFTINLEIMNLNKQNLLFSSDMRPVVKAVPSSPEWQRCQSTASTSMVDDDFHVRFRHRFEADGDVVYFAFSYPKSYAEMQADLERFDERYGVIEGDADTESDAKHDAIRLPVPDIYYHRDLLTTSLDGRRLDLVTVCAANSCPSALIAHFRSHLRMVEALTENPHYLACTQMHLETGVTCFRASELLSLVRVCIQAKHPLVMCLMASYSSC